MGIAFARQLHETGRAHGGSACFLYYSTFKLAVADGKADPHAYAFNGPHSLAIQNLLGLGLELQLKSAELRVFVLRETR